MSYRYFVLLFAILMLIYCKPSVEGAVDCSDVKYDDIAFVESWQDIYSLYVKYQYCSNRYISEGFADGITNLLANSWPSVKAFDAISLNDQRFHQFVLNHITYRYYPYYISLISYYAHNRCPHGHHELCSSLTKVTDRLLSASKPCVQSESMEAPGVLKNWEDIYASYKRYVQCDDGAVSEAYSDSICTMLANNWKSLHDLTEITDTDKDFLKFVIRHIDGSAHSHDLETIHYNAEYACAEISYTLCSLIQKRSAEVMKAVEEMRSRIK